MLIILSTLVFFFTRSLPGDVAALYIGGNAKPEQIERARIELGLDKPLFVQYKRYMGKLMHADMGISIRTHCPVFQDLKEKVPMSLKWFTAATVSIPIFFLALLLQLIFFNYLG
ncbi:MAG: ABC transporter permease [Deltaproteobacteria bacterium]|nr:ABC transporter permease [Candidatus Desulfobacula maris]MBL6995113.1 ABC transporter permease [Desulfobacula sp.]